MPPVAYDTIGAANVDAAETDELCAEEAGRQGSGVGVVRTTSRWDGGAAGQCRVSACLFCWLLSLTLWLVRTSVFAETCRTPKSPPMSASQFRLTWLLAQETWRNVSLNQFDLDAERINQGCPFMLEGHSAELIWERQLYVALARLPEVNTICEIGFNKGNSAMLWLRANPKAKVIMFDLWQSGEKNQCGLDTILAETTLEARERLTLVKGSSLLSVPNFRKEHPEVKCDLLSVDGGHSLAVASADIHNMMSLANKDFHILLLDDTNGKVGYEKANNSVDQALAKVLCSGDVLKLVGLSEGSRGRGVSVLQYVF